MDPFYRIQWTIRGTPAGFFIARYDVQDSRWNILTDDGAVLESMATWVLRNKKTLGQPGNDYTLYPGWIPNIGANGDVVYVDDYVGLLQEATHYQVIQHYPSIGVNGTVSAYTTLAPAVDPIWGTQTATDQYAKLNRLFYDTLSMRQLQIVDDNDVVRGQLSTVTDFSGKSYQPAMQSGGGPCERPRMFEIAGVTPSYDSPYKLRVWDIKKNVLRWS